MGIRMALILADSTTENCVFAADERGLLKIDLSTSTFSRVLFNNTSVCKYTSSK